MSSTHTKPSIFNLLITFFSLLTLLSSPSIFADTIEHYIKIANSIPQMEMKADPQAQTWARSARTVLILTSENILESLNLANDTAKQNGRPLFCPPNPSQVNANVMNDLIQQTYRDISSRRSDTNTLTVSQVALLGLKTKFPCPNTRQAVFNRMLHG